MIRDRNAVGWKNRPHWQAGMAVLPHTVTDVHSPAEAQNYLRSELPETRIVGRNGVNGRAATRPLRRTYVITSARTGAAGGTISGRLFICNAASFFLWKNGLIQPAVTMPVVTGL
jgi:hypothetical protein